MRDNAWTALQCCRTHRHHDSTDPPGVLQYNIRAGETSFKLGYCFIVYTKRARSWIFVFFFYQSSFASRIKKKIYSVSHDRQMDDKRSGENIPLLENWVTTSTELRWSRNGSRRGNQKAEREWDIWWGEWRDKKRASDNDNNDNISAGVHECVCVSDCQRSSGKFPFFQLYTHKLLLYLY